MADMANLRGTRVRVPRGAALGPCDGERAWVIGRGGLVCVVDLASGAVQAQRRVDGLGSVELHLGHLVWLDSSGGRAMALRDDLSGDVVSVAFPGGRPLWLLGAARDHVWVCSDDSEHASFAAWSFVPGGARPGAHVARGSDWRCLAADLVIGRTMTGVNAFDATAGRLAWETDPFADVGAKVHEVSPPVVVGAEIHVRARARRGSKTSYFVARLDARTGHTLAVRPSTNAVNEDLPDLGEGLEEVAATCELYEQYAAGSRLMIYRGRSCELYAFAGGRAGAPQAFAFPERSLPKIAGDRVLGIAELDGVAELVIVPLPADDVAPRTHAIELAPIGAAAGFGVETATVQFAGSSTLIIAQHPKLGRINLFRAPEVSPPPKGTVLELEGVEVFGTAVQVQSWRIAGGVTERRDVLTLPYVPHLADPVAPPASHLLPWHDGTREILSLVCPCAPSDIDSGETVDDPEVLACYDGARGHGSPLDSWRVAEAAPWTRAAAAELRFDHAMGTLACELQFALDRRPTEDEIARLVHAVDHELADSAWAVNLEWEGGRPVDGVLPHVTFAVRSHRIA